jgi:hypothetical protein
MFWVLEKKKQTSLVDAGTEKREIRGLASLTTPSTNVWRFRARCSSGRVHGLICTQDPSAPRGDGSHKCRKNRTRRTFLLV